VKQGFITELELELSKKAEEAGMIEVKS